ncbi:MAG: hypothetical protein AAGE80_09155 [Pseudomonadota bacterium]
MNQAAWQARVDDVTGRFGLESPARFLFSPWARIGDAEVVFASRNPGFSGPDAPDAGGLATDRSVYAEPDEAATTPMTGQVQALSAFLGVPLTRILAGTITPFRVARFGDLARDARDTAFELGRAFWSEVLARPRRLVIASGVEAAEMFREILGLPETLNIASGWGNTRLVRCGAPGRALVLLPNLSQYRLFARPACRAPLARVFEGLV